MERKIEQVIFSRPVISLLKNVAAYARVSSGKDAMLHSLSAQVSYYSEMIQKEPGWKFCGVYADEALTGTKDNREAFQRLLEACRAGQVDMIITKSIAPNTMTKLRRNQEVAMCVLIKICSTLKVNIGDIMDLIPDIESE